MIERANWIIAATILLVVFGSIYVIVQQAQRSGANYPQIQLAEDTASQLNAGTSIGSLTGPSVNMKTSLAPFIIIYSKNGQVVAGSGYLNNEIPKVDSGVLTASNNTTYNTVTWQPQKGVRLAVAVVSANKYYVLSGRSLTEVEKNENNTFILAIVGLVAAEFLLGLSYLVNTRFEAIRH